jgi:hypothetical protein
VSESTKCVTARGVDTCATVAWTCSPRTGSPGPSTPTCTPSHAPTCNHVGRRACAQTVAYATATATDTSPLAGFADADDVAVAWDAASVSRRKAVIGTLMTVTLLKAPRGRRPVGHYFDQEFVRIDWSRSPSWLVLVVMSLLGVAGERIR